MQPLRVPLRTHTRTDALALLSKFFTNREMRETLDRLGEEFTISESEWSSVEWPVPEEAPSELIFANNRVIQLSTELRGSKKVWVVTLVLRQGNSLEQKNQAFLTAFVEAGWSLGNRVARDIEGFTLELAHTLVSGQNQRRKH